MANGQRITLSWWHMSGSISMCLQPLPTDHLPLTPFRQYVRVVLQRFATLSFRPAVLDETAFHLQ